MATREAFKRNMPGRIIGVSVDRLGNKALRMALQMREQHIKRERATSNICTASALMASMAGFYCVYNGPKGLRRAAMTAHASAVAAAEAIKALGYTLAAEQVFDTLDIEAEAAVIQDIALAAGMNFYYPSEGRVRLSFDEVTTPDEVNAVVAVFAEAKGRKAKNVKVDMECDVPMRRTSPILAEPVFNRYHSESDMMRYIKRLELRDISLANSMISLGSCTMKLNAAALMQPLSLAGFQNIHPFAPADQTEGYTQLIAELEHDLAVITGFAGCSLQPNSGAAGEYSGLMVIRAYHQSRGQGLPQHNPHPRLGPRHQPRLGSHGRHEDHDRRVRRQRQHRRGGPEEEGRRVQFGAVRTDGYISLDARCLREPHPRDRRRGT